MHHQIWLAPPAVGHHQNQLYPPWSHFAMALEHHVEQGASTHCPLHPAYHSNSSNETRHVPLKEPLGALLIWQWHMVEFDWCHMSQFEWRSFKTFSPGHTASFDWPKCLNFQDGKSQHSIGLLVLLPTCVNIWLAFACFLCFCFSDTWQIYVGLQIPVVMCNTL